MSTGFKFKKVGLISALTLVAVLCNGYVYAANAAQSNTRKVNKSKAKKQELPPLPSGPTGPVQPMPLDSLSAVAPQVTYQDNQLTIVAPNSTLADILRAVRKSTGADIDVPAAPERVVTRLGPGPARDVLADLLNGSRFNYVMLGAPGNDTALTRVVLVAKGPTDSTPPNQSPARPFQQLGMAQTTSAPPQMPEAPAPDANDASMPEDGTAADDNTDQQPAPDAAEQPQNADQSSNPDQPQVKTPQQMLQEMQQRQMQLQQQQQPGQPVPGSGMPPHPPQEQ